MAPAPHSGSTAGDRGDARQKLKHDLDECEKRLRAMVAKYKAKPSAIDSGLDAADSKVDVEATVTEVYEIMSLRVYADDNPLQLADNLREAFQAQEDEFDEFYRSAVTALEAYKEVLKNYNLVKGGVPPRPERGDLSKIQQDVHAFLEERTMCIKAVTDFHGKFCAMLAVLRIL